MTTKTLALVIFLALLCPVAGYAASSVGSESSTSFTISLAIQPTLAITTESDISFNIANRDEDNEFSHSFCVQGAASEKYTLIAYGSNGDGSSFTLRNADNEVLRYIVSFRGNLGGVANFDQLLPGQPSPVYNVLPREQECGELTSFSVTFRAEDLRNAGSGLYSGSLTLLVSPV
jgi:hypothetical protein